ncbi:MULTISPECIES: fasciclin domain-containing protein [Actinosynnema]|uniref:Fasciclin n=1 Tax=Actinosynnema pretiosum TaxID=42197 RepID=A0A290ZEY3_9PSEU|nr:fasciclin domain-containing protein [Actinosynnema pretiosum]ATE57567.1 fasciclin [Actinosynnema pretiosum]
MRNSKLALVGTALVASLALTACGGSGDTASTSSAPAASSSAPMTQMSSADGATKTTDVFGPGCASVPQDPSNKGSLEGMVTDPVATAASNNPLLTKLVTAVKAANLVDTLNAQTAITVFAPADPAFEALGEAKFQELASKPEELAKVLQYHVVGKRYDAKGLEAAGAVKALTGEELKVTGSGESMMVNDAKVLCGNIPTKNATVFVIDTVLTPPAA